MQLSTNRTSASLLFVASLTMACTSIANANQTPTGNLIQDSGFESGSNDLQDYNRFCGNPWAHGEWNAEDADLISGPSVVSPHTGDGMLRVNETIHTSSQVTQLLNVEAYADEIDSGNAIAIFSVWVNPAAGGVNPSVVLQAGESQTCVGTLNPINGSFVQGFNTATASLAADADAETWELMTCSLPLAVGTRFLVLQVAARNEEIPAEGVFFDTASVAICTPPQPCRPDIDQDGSIGVTDLAEVILNWGLCP